MPCRLRNHHLHGPIIARQAQAIFLGFLAWEVNRVSCPESMLASNDNSVLQHRTDALQDQKDAPCRQKGDKNGGEQRSMGFREVCWPGDARLGCRDWMPGWEVWLLYQVFSDPLQKRAVGMSRSTHGEPCIACSTSWGFSLILLGNFISFPSLIWP